MAVHDILASEVVPGELDATGAATPPLEVSLNPAPVNGTDMPNWNGDKWFDEGDNIALKNIWCFVPFGFGQGNGPHVLNLEWKDSLNNSISIPELGVGIAGEGGIIIPEINCPVPLPSDGLFIKTPVGSGRVRLTIFASTLKISMVNIPAALIGATIAPIYHFQVFHTKQMQAIP